MKGESHVKKTIIALNTAIVLSLTSLSTGVQAESVNSLEEKKSQIQNKKSEVESNLNAAEKKISEIQGEQSEVRTELEKVEKSISETTEKIKEKNKQIATTEDEVQDLKVDIKATEERIKKRNEILKERARSYQKNGGNNNYLEVVFGASSFGEFVERIGAVTTIVDADKEILIQQEKDKADLEKKRAQVEKKLANLKTMKKDLEGMKDKLDGVKVEKNRLMMHLKSKQKQVESQKLDLEEQNQLLASQAEAIKKAIQLEKDRQAEAAKAAAEAKAAQNNTSVSSSGGSVDLPPVSSGMFTRPAAGYLSSGFGGRWGGNHYGIDIAKRGHVPIVAAASGVVTRSAYSSSYGNVVYITHSINGQVYTTVYAHMSSRMVREGATVSKGQQIGVMGNTGQSFGQHLHFELYVGPWTASHSNAVNPLSYLSGM